MFRLVEPIGVVTYQAPEPTEALLALGLRDVWDAYFAGRAAALGPVPAEVVHALFYNFANGEVARHVPRIWEQVTPDAALRAREEGSVAALHRILGPLADDPSVARAADVLMRAATSAPTPGRPMYAAVRRLPVPAEPLARLWHAATLVREHRGDGHVAALVCCRIGGTEAHVLHTLSEGVPAERFGRTHHLPRTRLAAVVDAMRVRGLVDASGSLTADGRALKERVESLTDELAAAPYETLGLAEFDQLVADLTPIAAALDATGSQ